MTRTQTHLLILAVAACIGAAMWDAIANCIGDTQQLVARLDTGHLALTLGLCIVYRIINAAGWTIGLRALGTNLPIATGTRIWISSESCRWLPGSVWGYGSRAVLAKKAGVPMTTAAAATALELAVTLVSWTLLATLAFAMDASSRELLSTVLPRSSSSFALVLGSVFAVAFWGWKARPTFLTNYLARFSVLKKCTVSIRGALTTFAFFVAINLFNGMIVVWFLQFAMGVSAPVVVVISGNAVAWLVGFFAVFAPGGLVVREAALAAILAKFLGASDAIAVATLIRGLHLLSELACLPLLMTARITASGSRHFTAQCVQS